MYPKSSFTKATWQTRLKQELPPPPSLFGSRSEPTRRAETIHAKGCHQHPWPTTPLHLWVGSFRHPSRLGRGHQNPPPTHKKDGGHPPDWTPGMRWDFRGCWLSIYKGRNSPASVLHEAWGAPDLVTTLLFDYTKPNPRIPSHDAQPSWIHPGPP